MFGRHPPKAVEAYDFSTLFDAEKRDEWPPFARSCSSENLKSCTDFLRENLRLEDGDIPLESVTPLAHRVAKWISRMGASLGVELGKENLNDESLKGPENLVVLSSPISRCNRFARLIATDLNP